MPLQGTFELPDRNVDLAIAEPLLITRAARQADVVLNTSCAGQGSCGGCAVDLLAGRFDVHGESVTIATGQRKRVLGCQTTILSDNWSIAVPAHSLVRAGFRVLDEFELPAQLRLEPLVRKFAMHLARPSMEDSVGDFERICRVLRAENGLDRIRPTLAMLQQLPEVLIEADYHVTVTLAENYGLWEVVGVEPGDTTGRLFALAIDIGTTSVVCCLVDLNTAEIVDSVSSYNQQVQRCDDVASRIIYASTPDQLKDLQQLIVEETLNRNIRLLCTDNGVPREEIVRAVVSGNTIMTHLFLGVNPRNMGGVPFQPGVDDPGTFRARALGLAIHDDGFVDVVPSISAYVGGDITSDIHLSGLARGDELAMVIDVGTNAEMAIGNRERILACATPAGPAYEGAGLSCGVRACDGAIEAMTIDPQTYRATCEVIGDLAPSGICGSGLIDFLAEARRHGLIDLPGRLTTQARERTDLVRQGDNGVYEYVVVPAGDTEDGQTDLVITEKDIERLLQAKAVIYAGIVILLKNLGRSLDDVARVYLAGGFANHINLANAMTIGMLPDLPEERYRVIGNASLAGAYLATLDGGVWHEFDQIVTQPTVIELNKDPDFEDEFTFALFLPNLELDRFPRIAADLP